MKARKPRSAGAPWRVQSDQAGEFDELVVASWMHLERMDRRQWWLRLGQVEFDITIDTSGRPCLRVRNGKIVKGVLRKDGET